MKTDRRKWPGGYIHRQEDGRDLFILERKVAKKRYHLSTRAHTLVAAMAQLERFEANPEDYTPRGDKSGRLIVDADLVDGYFDFLVEVKKTTRHHANVMRTCLADWSDDLKGKDLRRLELVDLKEPLAKRRSQQHRIIAIKGFCAWLRKEKGVLTSAEDRTLELAVPQASPEKHRRRKVVTPDRIAAAWKRLPTQRHRDMLELLAATGMHVREVERFIRGVDAELVPQAGGGAVVVVRHKTGVLTRIPLTAKEHVEAAERLRGGGEVPRRFNQVLAEACLAAKVEPFTAGVLRHSVATYAVEQGATPEQVAAFLHHKDPRTTLRFYVDLARPVDQVPVPRLKLVKGGR